MSKFLDDFGLTHFWNNVKSYIGSIGSSLVKDNGVIDVKTPVEGIVTQQEYEALSPEKQNHGVWFVDDISSSGGGHPSEEIYSEAEVRIGTWFGKPLYRKCYIFTNMTKNEDRNVSINFGQYPYFSARGIFANSVYTFTDSYEENIREMRVWVNRTVGVFARIKVTSDSPNFNSNFTVYIITEYTKTTD